MTTANEEKSQKAKSESESGQKKAADKAQAEGDTPKRLEPNLPEYDAKQREYERTLEEEKEKSRMIAKDRAESAKAGASSAQSQAQRAEEEAKAEKKTKT